MILGNINRCLVIPACVEELIADDSAIVNLGGIRKEISLALVDDVVLGDYVIVHVGYAIQKLDQVEAAYARDIGLIDDCFSLNPSDFKKKIE